MNLFTALSKVPGVLNSRPPSVLVRITSGSWHSRLMLLKKINVHANEATFYDMDADMKPGKLRNYYWNRSNEGMDFLKRCTVTDIELTRRIINKGLVITALYPE